MTTKKELIDKVKSLKSTNKGEIKGSLTSMTKDQLEAIIEKFSGRELKKTAKLARDPVAPQRLTDSIARLNERRKTK